MGTALYESLCHLNGQTEVTVSKNPGFPYVSSFFLPRLLSWAHLHLKMGNLGLERCG